jgi:hypothetical protein
MSHGGGQLSEAEAKLYIAREYPEQCGPCGNQASSFHEIAMSDATGALSPLNAHLQQQSLAIGITLGVLLLLVVSIMCFLTAYVMLGVCGHPRHAHGFKSPRADVLVDEHRFCINPSGLPAAGIKHREGRVPTSFLEIP